MTAFHCENHAVVQFLRGKLVSEGNTAPIYHAKSRPNLAEAEAVRRVLYLAKLAGDAPVYIVHLSCKESLEAVKDARAEGQKNILETLAPKSRVEELEDEVKFLKSMIRRINEDVQKLQKAN